MDAYIGQIEIFGFGFPPRGWALCAGQLLSIGQNQALFSLLGTTFGGDGMRTFALPDLRGRTPIGQGRGGGLSPRPIGELVGEESHTLLISETPYHVHNLWTLNDSDTSSNVNTPDPTVLLAKAAAADPDGKSLTMTPYYPIGQPNLPMAPTAIGSTGGQAHLNMMPYLALNVCIALQGLYPERG
ncbi:MAG: phage tail protein [Alphaproteobacteria bacterium]|nr:phage tail protein [Alphaproteobacteria bacterium]MBV8407541.1 phage tail protein [Alphaproteobacteria bacterium]